MMMTPWIEVWIDSAAHEYVLVVRGKADETVEIVDPQESWKVIEAFQTYADAVHWLNEDEYDLVEGRVGLAG